MSQVMKIAIVDDEQDMRQSISQWLALSGFDTETFPSAEDALTKIGSDYPGIVISDIKMPGHGWHGPAEEADGQRQQSACGDDHWARGRTDRG